ncbi:MAG: CHASE domain-containing protein [Granulosicoccus sp.]
MRLSLTQILKNTGSRLIRQCRPVKGMHWILVAASLLATVIAWQLAVHSTHARIATRFDRQAAHAISLFSEQMQRYGDILKSGVAYAAVNDVIHPDEWSEFIHRMELAEQFPAISGVGVVYRVGIDDIDEFVEDRRRSIPTFKVRPAVEPDLKETREYVLPITLLWPDKLAEVNTGLDVAREQRRRNAIERTMATGQVQITAPIRPEALEEPGFVMIAPIFDSSQPSGTEQRQTEFAGAVVAAVITRNLAQGILESDIRQVAIRVSDESETMYNELLPDNEEIDPQPLMTDVRIVPFFGRDWRFDIHSTKAFRNENADSTPSMILIGGLLIDALLLVLFTYMARSNQKAVAFGERISRKYQQQSKKLRIANKSLENRNGELEAFSYLVSHDLKTPLRGIGFLADCIQEDLDGHQQGSGLPSDITFHVKRINKQVTLAQGLIHGVLQYSGLGNEKETPEEVNMVELLNSLQVMQAVDETQLKLEGELPTFTTYRIRLTQVLMNLIGNAYKYHHGQGLAVVTVGIEQSLQADFYRFTVADNGPGIKDVYHQKIFEPFSTLQPKDQSMSSGVGLAIVHKLVSHHGGRIEVSSEEGVGTCFHFDWPRSVSDATVAEYSEHTGDDDYKIIPKAA